MDWISERERSCYGLNCVPSESHVWDFPDGPVVKNLPCNTENVGTQARLQQLLWTSGPATPLSSALPGTCVTPQLTQPPGARPGRPGTRDGRVPWEVGSPRAQVGSLALGTTEKVFHVIPGLT